MTDSIINQRLNYSEDFYGTEINRLCATYKHIYRISTCQDPTEASFFHTDGREAFVSLCIFDNYAIYRIDGSIFIFLNDLSDLNNILRQWKKDLGLIEESDGLIFISQLIKEHGEFIVTKIPYDLRYKTEDLYENLDVNVLIRDFLDSKSYILFLFGNVGTGKSSIVRRLIGQNSTLSYINVTSRDFIDDDAFQILKSKLALNSYVVILDDLYSDLENRNNNKFIQHLTQLTSGLYNNYLKIIITTNQEISKIDPVLIRPGRCFDYIEIRSMSREFYLKKWAELTSGNDIANEWNETELSQAEFMERLAVFLAPINHKKYRNALQNKAKVGF